MRKLTLLCSVPWAVTTSILPLVAPAGTLVVICDGETTVNVAGVPLKVTLVEPVNALPRMVTDAPTAAVAGFGLTNGRRPMDSE
jgi:hypothetical protein